MINKITVPAIHQAVSIVGRTIKLRNVKPDDADFIVNLRTNEKRDVLLAQHLRILASRSNGLNDICQAKDRHILLLKILPAIHMALYVCMISKKILSAGAHG